MRSSATARNRAAAVNPYMNSLGHCGRALVAARALRNEGWHVVALGEGAFSWLFEESGIPVFPCRSVPYDDLGKWMAYYLAGLPFVPSPEKGVWNRPHTRYSLESCARGLLRALEEHEPAVAISDGTPWARIACQAGRVPHIALTNWTWTADFVARMHPPVPAGLDKDETLKSYIHTPEPLVAAYNAVVTQFGAQPITASWQALAGEVCALADDAVLLPDALPPGLPPSGALCWDGERASPHAWPMPQRPYMVVSTGTSSSSAIDAFLSRRQGRMPFAPVTIGNVRHNGRERSIAPAHRLLCGSAGFICHGGSQSLHQALYARVPTLVIPTHFEQLWNGWLFARHDGFWLWPEDARGQEETWEQFVRAAKKRSPVEEEPLPFPPMASKLPGICETVLTKGGRIETG